MAHTYFQNFYHLVWSTKEREPMMHNESKQRMFEYLGGAFKTAGCNLYLVGGMSDHVHVLTGIPPKYSVSEVVRDIKICSSKWFSALPNSQNFAWQEGFGSFTVSASQQDMVFKYILNQEEHHKKRTFKEEFTELLKKHGIEYDEKFLWK